MGFVKTNYHLQTYRGIFESLQNYYNGYLYKAFLGIQINL